jgi:hypothetical protein
MLLTEVAGDTLLGRLPCHVAVESRRPRNSHPEGSQSRVHGSRMNLADEARQRELYCRLPTRKYCSGMERIALIGASTHLRVIDNLVLRRMIAKRNKSLILSNRAHENASRSGESR